MREIGVRALKATLSETLRAVGRGETVRVTVRGKPLADLVPAGAAGDDRLRRLIVAGKLTPATRSQPARAPRLSASTVPASEFVLAEREFEG